MVFSTRKLVFAGLCVALGVVLPLAFHAVPNAGRVFLPMHIPVLLCGMICGWPYGLACGLLAPALSTLLTGMPPAAMLPAMLCELSVYGLIAGLLITYLRTGRRWLDLYTSLVLAMLSGRLIMGLVNAFIFSAGTYSVEIFVSAAFVTALPGIAIQLVLLPALVRLLDKLGVTMENKAKAA